MGLRNRVGADEALIFAGESFVATLVGTVVALVQLKYSTTGVSGCR